MFFPPLLTLKRRGNTLAGWPLMTKRRELSFRRLASRSSKHWRRNLAGGRWGGWGWGWGEGAEERTANSSFICQEIYIYIMYTFNEKILMLSELFCTDCKMTSVSVHFCFKIMKDSFINWINCNKPDAKIQWKTKINFLCVTSLFECKYEEQFMWCECAWEYSTLIYNGRYSWKNEAGGSMRGCECVLVTDEKPVTHM